MWNLISNNGRVTPIPNLQGRSSGQRHHAIGELRVVLLHGTVAQLVARDTGRQRAVVPSLVFRLLTAYSRLAAALSILSVGLLLGRIDYHSPAVVSSWLLLAPMTGALSRSGLICFLWAGVFPALYRHSLLPHASPTDLANPLPKSLVPRSPQPPR